ncbi:unnamed protein product [Brassicogethes aeneus]|uniref:Uncharacterized protein n=1 Tax=Brassicogethes aeneus TaxID=1431903 RepID=A0A9P0FNN3_BRAAE|nr:unnamed protein product [Brassicogethes aeneus]
MVILEPPKMEENPTAIANIKNEILDAYTTDEYDELEQAIKTNIKTENNEESPPKKNKRTRHLINKRKQAQENRMKGYSYVGYVRTKNGRVSHNQERPSRSQRACNSANCALKSKKCLVFPKEDLEKMFDDFWELSWEEKREYVLGLVDYVPKKSARLKGPSRRLGTFNYYLEMGKVRLPVCKNMFLGSLGLGENMVQSWVKSNVVLTVPEVEVDGPKPIKIEVEETHNLDSIKSRVKPPPDSSPVKPRDVSRIKRMKGLPYLGYSRDEDGKIIQNQIRPPRTQKFCNSSFCATIRKHCASFSKKELQKVFHEFWNFTWDEKKSYVTSLIDLIPKKRVRVSNVSRRSGTYIYHLIKDEQKLPVCKKMFLGSLGLGESMVQSWVRSCSREAQKIAEIKTPKKLAECNKTKKKEKGRYNCFNMNDKTKILRKRAKAVVEPANIKTEIEIVEDSIECKLEEPLLPFSCEFDKIQLPQ